MTSQPNSGILGPMRSLLRCRIYVGNRIGDAAEVEYAAIINMYLSSIAC